MYMLYHRRTRGLCHFMPLMYRSTFNVGAISTRVHHSVEVRPFARFLRIPFWQYFIFYYIMFYHTIIRYYVLSLSHVRMLSLTCIFYQRRRESVRYDTICGDTWKQIQYYWLMRCKRTCADIKKYKERRMPRFDLALLLLLRNDYIYWESP